MKVRIGVSIGSHQTDIVSPDGSVMIEHEVQVRFMDMAEFSHITCNGKPSFNNVCS